jgi:hypothetical protein
VTDPQPSPWSPRPGGDRSPARRIDPAVRSGFAAFYWGVSGLVMSIMFFPVGLVLDVAAVILGVRARRRARAAGVSRGPATAAVCLGAGGVALVGVILALLGPELTSYSSCLSGANTQIAKDNCRTALYDRLERRFHIQLPQ